MNTKLFHLLTTLADIDHHIDHPLVNILLDYIFIYIYIDHKSPSVSVKEHHIKEDCYCSL